MRGRSGIFVACALALPAIAVACGESTLVEAIPFTEAGMPGDGTTADGRVPGVDGSASSPDGGASTADASMSSTDGGDADADADGDAEDSSAPDGGAEAGTACTGTGGTKPTEDPGGVESPDQPVPYPGKAFGFNHGLLPNGETTIDRGLDLLVQLGTTHYRGLGIHWRGWETSTSAAQPVPAQFSDPVGASSGGLADLDASYQRLLARSIVPILVVHGSTLWASKFAICQKDAIARLDLNRCPLGWDSQDQYFVDPAYYPQYRQFVAAAAARYPQAIIEATNEPDYVWQYRSAFSVPPAQAADQACAAYDAVKSVSGSRFVLSSGMYNPTFIDGYLARVAERGTKCHDAFSLHGYPYPVTSFGAGSSLAFMMNGIRAIRGARADATPLWITEVGFSTSDANAPLTSAEQGVAVRAVYNRLATICDVEAILFHTLRDSPFPYAGGNDPQNREYGLGLFSESWAPKGGGCFLLRQRGVSNASCP